MNESETGERIAANWRGVQDDVRAAAESNGRDPDDVRIVGVSKYVDAATTGLLIEAGCHCLGESRPQVLWQKAEELSATDSMPAIQWHLIGHLQRNKVRRLLKCSPYIESVDSKRLLETIAQESVQQNHETSFLLEVNVSGDEAKTGFAPDELASVINSLPENGVNFRGLMAMAGWGTDPEQARKQFAAVRRLRDQLSQETGMALPELSMGMSGDFPQAIAEGATIVRIGSRLFEGV